MAQLRRRTGDPGFVRFLDNLTRISNLILIYRDLPGSKKRGRRTPHATDVLRAAVVLLHANFEEMCREIEAEFLPHAGKEAIDEVPLIAIGKHGSAEKFKLGSLSAFQHLGVDALIRNSINAHLATRSYTSTDAFVGMLERVGMDAVGTEPLMPALAELMARRHRIAHTCDRNPKTGSGQHTYAAIDPKKVEDWMMCVGAIHLLLQKKIAERRKQISAASLLAAKSP